MNDPVISRFTEACGATGPLDLRIDSDDGGVLAEGSVPMPFSLVGRDDACDVTLADAEVNPRHAWLQVVGGRVFAVDLGSRTGLVWPDGATGSGWLDPGVPVRVGPFRVGLRGPPAAFPPGYNPLQSDPDVMRAHPAVALEFRNGRRAHDRWVVNRLVTLVGRVPECKIHLTADDIVGHHCGLVLTPDGLWVVDLSGRGVVVNGERMRVSPLRHGAELWVGRFLIGVHYPALAVTPPPGRAGAGVLTTPTPVPGLPDVPAAEAGAGGGGLSSARGSEAGGLTAPAPPVPGEDEVPVGIAPTPDPNAGLPSSHILADAFRLWSGTPGGGPISNQILVVGSGALPGVVPGPRPADPEPPAEQPPEAVVPLLRQLGELNAQMFAQFRQSLVLMVRLFGCLPRDQWPAVERELARIQELNTALAALQGEVAHRAVGVADSTPQPQPAPPPPTDSTALHEWVLDRLESLQRERQARWQSLVGAVGGTG